MAPGLRNAINPATDVIVIGAGPAGTAAAISCATAGYSVRQLAAKSAVHQRPGESLHPGIMTLFRRLGLERDVLAADFLRYPGQTVDWGSPAKFDSFGGSDFAPWLGFHAPRRQLDELMLRQAQNVGVQIIKPCRAARLLSDGGRVRGIATNCGDFQAQIVIDAAGGQHWLARQANLGIYRASRPLVAYYGFDSHHCGRQLDVPHLQADREGWTWTAPLPGGGTSWVSVPFQPGKQQLRRLACEHNAVRAGLARTLRGLGCLGKVSPWPLMCYTLVIV